MGNARDAFVIRTDAVYTDNETTITLTVDLPDGVHIEPHEPAEPYLIPTVVSVDNVDDAAIRYPAPVIKDLRWHDAQLVVLEGAVAFEITMPAAVDVDRVSGTLAYQPCIGGACLPPRTVMWSAPLAGATSYSVLHALAA